MTDEITTAPLDLDALRKIAEAATRGPWWTGQHSLGARKIDVISDGGWHMPKTEADASHIAAFDPPTVIALLDYLDAVTAERAALYDKLNGTPSSPKSTRLPSERREREK